MCAVSPHPVLWLQMLVLGIAAGSSCAGVAICVINSTLSNTDSSTGESPKAVETDTEFNGTSAINGSKRQNEEFVYNGQDLHNASKDSRAKGIGKEAYQVLAEEDE